MNKKELKKVISDRDYWRDVAKSIGCTLYGFSYRSCATFYDPTGQSQIEIPGWLGETILKLRDDAKIGRNIVDVLARE